MTLHPADYRHVIVFDGECPLCTCAVRFVLRHERDRVIRFAPAQSARGRALFAEIGMGPESPATIVFIKDGRAHRRSDAVLEVAVHLRWPWRILRLLGVIPRPLRDWTYDFIARHRYRWFGRRDSCMVPGPELKSRFLDG